jgi:uncharacterized protein YebE (UPF0316 family)
METLLENLGISPEIFRLFVLPILIFCARIADVSINTIRIIFMLNGRRLISTFLGFFESLIWLMAIGQIFQNIDSTITYLAYAGGFACGILVGMWIEEKLAVGRVLIRVITQKSADELVDYFQSNNYRHSVVDGYSSGEKVNIIFTVVRRTNLPQTLEVIKNYNPLAFYTIEGVKKVSDEDLVTKPNQMGWTRRIRKH